MREASDLEIYRADSGPDTEDGYGAPTKVGPMSRARVAQLMMAAEDSERERIHGSTRYSSSIQTRARRSDEPTAIPTIADVDADATGFEPTKLQRVERQSTLPLHVDRRTTERPGASAQAVRTLEVRSPYIPVECPPSPLPSLPSPTAIDTRRSDLRLALQIGLAFLAFVATAVPALYVLFRG